MGKKLFTVYKITNLVNSKFYVGVHETSKPTDDYLGSGLAIKRAIKKYGVESFLKEVLFIYETATEAFSKEVELLTSHRDNPLCYNLHPGGKGGFGYIREKGLHYKIPPELQTGRPKGSKQTITILDESSDALCNYGCGEKAKVLVGKKEVPCCSQDFRGCPGYLSRKKKVIPAPYEGSDLCSYGCGSVAKFTIGNRQKLCCSESFYDCDGHWGAIQRTNILRYGAKSSFGSAEVRRKIQATFDERFSGNPSCDPTVREKFDRTVQVKFGGPAPMSSPEVREKFNLTVRARFGGPAPMCSSAVKEKYRATRKKTLRGE